MKFQIKKRAIFCALILLTAFGAPLRAETDEGKVEEPIWSGYWWPIAKGELLGPLSKYDALTGKKAADWERKHNPPGANVPGWHGYCHAWAASSIMEPEPRESRTVDGKTFSIGDQKGLLAACHARDVANSYGRRYNGSDDDPNDIAPDELWLTLRRYLKEQRRPIVFDLEPGAQVWNYPAYAYRVNYERVEGNLYRCTLDVWLADDAVPKDFVGIKKAHKKYEFEVQMRNGSVVLGTGKWIGNSRKDHPDFVWAPYVVRPESPEVDYRLVCGLLGTNPTNPTPAPAPAPNPAPNPVPTPAPNPAPNPDAVVDVAPETSSEGTISALELIALVKGKKSDWTFDISIDKFDGGLYEVGETLVVRGKSEKAGYLYLIAVEPDESLSLIYPRQGVDNRIEANKEFAIPDKNAEFCFRTTEPTGNYRIKAIVSENPIEIEGTDASFDGDALTDGELRWTPALLELAREAIAEFSPVEASASSEQTASSLGRFAQDEVSFGIIPTEKKQDE